MSWRVRGYRSSPALLGCLAFDLALAVLCCIGGLVWLGLVLLLGAVVYAGRVLAAIEYHLGPGGVTAKESFTWHHHHWEEFQGVWVDGNKVCLRFRPRPLREPLELTTRANLDEVVAYVEAHVPQRGSEGYDDE